jgi:hypothetical protein
LAPDLLTPQVSRAAWATPAARIAHEAAKAASWLFFCGQMASSMIRFSSTGAPADSTKRSRAFSTPDRWATMAMQGRYGMEIWVRVTASLNLAGSAAKPGLIRYISHGMANWAATVMPIVAAARVAMASAASSSAFLAVRSRALE